MEQDNFQMSRLGQFTASNIHALLKAGKKKDVVFGDTAMSYIREKIAEAITGESKPQVRSTATDWGNEHETDAIMWFEQITGKKVEHFGVSNYKYFPYNSTSGCSPDGLVVGEQSIIQVKCPYLAANHVEYLLAPKTMEWLKANQPEYYTQCQFEMMCTKRDLCYFVSYHPSVIEPHHRMAVFVLTHDVELRNELASKIELATAIVRESLQSLQTYSGILLTPQSDGIITVEKL